VFLAVLTESGGPVWGFKTVLRTVRNLRKREIRQIKPGISRMLELSHYPGYSPMEVPFLSVISVILTVSH